MKPESRDRDFQVSQTVYERLLLAYPQSHRAEYGSAMAQLFRDQCRDAWGESRHWGLLTLWLRTLPDLACTSILERLAALRERKTVTDKLANLFGFRATPAAAFFKVFIPVFLLVFLVSVVITFILPESYASTARLKIESEANGIAYDPYFLQTTFEIIQSEVVLKPVIEKLNLNVQWGKKYFNGETLKTSETTGILKPRLQMATVKNTKLIAITVFDDDKHEAAQIANAVAESYRDYRIQARSELAAKTGATMQQLYQSQELQIKQAQADLDEQQRKFGISDRVEDLKAQAAKGQMRHSEMEGELTLLRSLHKEELRAVLPRVVADATLSELLINLHEAEGKYALTNNGPLAGATGAPAAVLDDLNKQIDERVAGIMAGLEARAASIKAASDALAPLAEKATPTPFERPYWDAKQNLEQLAESHKMLFAKIENQKLDAQLPKPPLVQITDTAEPGGAPVKPNKTLNIALGAFAGVFLASAAGAAFAFLSFFVGKRMRTTAAAPGA